MHPINRFVAHHIETIIYTGSAMVLLPFFGYVVWGLAKEAMGIRMNQKKQMLEMLQSANEAHPGLYAREAAIQQGRVIGSILCVSNLAPQVGYAWWLMQRFWGRLAQEMPCNLVFKIKSDIPEHVTKIGPVHFADMSTLKSLRLIRQLNVKHIYLTDWSGLHPIYLLWRLCGVKSIIVHDHVPGDPEPVGGLRGIAKQLAYRLRIFSATRCISVADHVRERHFNTWRAPEHKCRTVTNGIDPFPIDPGKRDEVRQSLGIPLAAKVAVMVCRAVEYKGLGFAIDLLEKAKDLHIAHFGDGPDLERFKAMAAARGVADRMHYLGHRSHVRELLPAFDLALHPSRGEAMSLAILEYMCAGLPVVVPNIRSVQAATREGVTGRTYAPDHVPSALQAINTITPTMGQRAREAVLSHYNFARTMAEFEQHVVSLINPVLPVRQPGIDDTADISPAVPTPCHQKTRVEPEPVPGSSLPPGVTASG